MENSKTTIGGVSLNLAPILNPDCMDCPVIQQDQMGVEAGHSIAQDDLNRHVAESRQCPGTIRRETKTGSVILECALW